MGQAVQGGHGDADAEHADGKRQAGGDERAEYHEQQRADQGQGDEFAAFGVALGVVGEVVGDGLSAGHADVQGGAVLRGGVLADAAQGVAGAVEQRDLREGEGQGAVLGAGAVGAAALRGGDAGDAGHVVQAVQEALVGGVPGGGAEGRGAAGDQDDGVGVGLAEAVAQGVGDQRGFGGGQAAGRVGVQGGGGAGGEGHAERGGDQPRDQDGPGVVGDESAEDPHGSE